MKSIDAYAIFIRYTTMDANADTISNDRNDRSTLCIPLAGEENTAPSEYDNDSTSSLESPFASSQYDEDTTEACFSKEFRIKGIGINSEEADVVAEDRSVDQPSTVHNRRNTIFRNATSPTQGNVFHHHQQQQPKERRGKCNPSSRQFVKDERMKHNTKLQQLKTLINDETGSYKACSTIKPTSDDFSVRVRTARRPPIEKKSLSSSQVGKDRLASSERHNGMKGIENGITDTDRLVSSERWSSNHVVGGTSSKDDHLVLSENEVFSSSISDLSIGNFDLDDSDLSSGEESFGRPSSPFKHRMTSSSTERWSTGEHTKTPVTEYEKYWSSERWSPNKQVGSSERWTSSSERWSNSDTSFQFGNLPEEKMVKPKRLHSPERRTVGVSRNRSCIEYQAVSVHDIVKSQDCTTTTSHGLLDRNTRTPSLPISSSDNGHPHVPDQDSLSLPVRSISSSTCGSDRNITKLVTAVKATTMKKSTAYSKWEQNVEDNKDRGDRSIFHEPKRSSSTSMITARIQQPPFALESPRIILQDEIGTAKIYKTKSDPVASTTRSDSRNSIQQLKMHSFDDVQDTVWKLDC